MIKNVKIKNWRSHWDSEFNFSGGTNALIGVMGAGKSSLLDSMCFALFGTFPALQARKITLDNVIMNRPQKRDRAEVEVSFQVNEDNYSVKRVVERGKGTTLAEFRKNGTLLDTGSSRTTENVEKILKIDYDLFSRAIYSEQNGLDNFLTIPRGQRMKKIDSLLKIDRFEKARSSTTTLMNRIKDNIKDKTRIVDEMEEKQEFGKIDEIKAEIKDMMKKQVDLEVKRKKIGDEKGKVEKKAEKMKEKMEKLREMERELSTIEGTIHSLNQDVKNFKKESSEKEIKKRIARDKKVLKDSSEKFQKKEEKIKELISKESKYKVFIEELVDRIENLKVVKGRCPMCDRELTEEHRENIMAGSREKIKELEKNFKETREKIKKLEESSGELKREIEKAREGKYELEKLLERIVQYDKKKGKLNGTEKKRKDLKEKIEAKREKSKEDQMDELHKKLQELSGTYSELGANIENNEKMLNERESQLKELKEKKDAFNEYKKQIRKMSGISHDLKKFEKSLKETQLILRKKFVNAVNLTMNRLWDYLYPYEDLTDIRLSVAQGDYNLELKESGGAWVSVEGIASGGERTTAALALRIALALVLAPNLKWLVLDEPTHNLDVQAVDYLAEVLRTRVGEFVDQVFLITHDEKLEKAVTGYLYKLERKREKNEPTQVNLISSPMD